MKMSLRVLVTFFLLVAAVCQDPAPPCKDDPTSCAPDSDGNPTYCLNLAFTLANGTTAEKSSCTTGACADNCVNQDDVQLTCDASACDTGLCTCTIPQSGAAALLTGVVKGTLKLAGGVLVGATGLVIGIAATVPKLVQALTGGLSIDKLVGIVNTIPLVGPLVTGVLKNLGILDAAGQVLGNVLNIANGLVGAVSGAVGGVAKAAEGVVGGLLGGLSF